MTEKKTQTMRKPTAGFVGFGEINTPREIIEEKCSKAVAQLVGAGIDVVQTPPVSDDPAGREALRAVDDLAGASFDFLVICVAGWIPTHTIIRVISEFSNKPMLLWGLAGNTQDGRLITTADQAGTTALRRTMEDMGYRFTFVYNCPDAEPKMDRISAFANAARAAAMLRQAKVGMMGFRDMRLYATLFDGVSLRGRIGVEIECFEMLEIVQRIEQLQPKDVSAVVADIRASWQFDKPADDAVLEKGARYYLAIREKVKEQNYQAISLVDVDGMKKLAQFPPAMIFMLLSDKDNVCTIPENDSLGAVTQLMVRFATGQIAAYLEFYEFMEDRVLMGVPDYVPTEIVDGPTRVTPASFGDLSGGLLNISKVRTGPVTLCRLTSKGDDYAMHIVTGQGVEPRPWEEAGWSPPAPQLPGLEVVLDEPVDCFADKVLGQHYILSYGDRTGELNHLCRLLGIRIL